MSATLLNNQIMHGRQMCTHHLKHDDDDASAVGFMPIVCVTTLNPLQQPSNWTGYAWINSETFCFASVILSVRAG